MGQNTGLQSDRRLTELSTRGSDGCLIVNADDWGSTCETTDRTYECWMHGSVSAVSAMMFMSDTERATDLARQWGIDAGLHLNLTTPLSAPSVPSRLREQQQTLASFLQSSRISKTFYHPLLRKAFDYVIATQIDEYRRLYGRSPERIDGHHHMHLCSNVLFDRLLPDGIVVRRNFTFGPKEKSWVNRSYRTHQDRRLKQRYRIVDHLFSLMPLNVPGRLEHIAELARASVVELETHPVLEEEYRFLRAGGMQQIAADCPIVRRFAVRGHEC